MIELHTWSTPNGRKVSILLEELGLPYTVHAVDLGQQQQFSPSFLAISPNNKIPAIVDRRAVAGGGEPVRVFESGAILAYLCETTPGGEALWPSSSSSATAAARARVHQWLMWQMGGIGPFMGRAYRFLHRRPGDPDDLSFVAGEFLDEVTRLLGVMDRQLADTGAFLAGDYSIADIATFPWVQAALPVFVKARPALADFSHVQRWRDAIAARPAVERGMRVPQP
jgi:GSH-dependent disulfide-bond oxidoreductase